LKLQNDNCGTRALIGTFIVGSEAVPEAEWWAMLPPSDLYPRGMGFAQEVEPHHAQIMAGCPTDAEGVLIAGGRGFAAWRSWTRLSRN
jgi:maleate isomerase